MNIEVPEDPWTCLFYSIDTPINQYKNTLLPHLIYADKSFVPQQWQEQESPSVIEWMRKIEKRHKMEHLRGNYCEQGKKVWEVWKSWTKFKIMKYVEMVGNVKISLME